MRYLAIDLGDKRTGIAVGDTVTGLVSPADVLEVPLAHGDGAALLKAIGRAAEVHLGPADGRVISPGEIVVGLPLNMDGTEGLRSRLVRAFAARIGEQTRRRVHLHDERLTSADADWAMARSGLTHKQKKQRRDALAAAAVLRDFFFPLRKGRDVESAAPDPIADDERGSAARPAGNGTGAGES